MEKVEDFFSNITPTCASLLLIAFGVLLIVGAIRRWKWVLDTSGEVTHRSLRLRLYNLFGEKGLRIGTIILGVTIILGTLAFMVISKYKEVLFF